MTEELLSTFEFAVHTGSSIARRVEDVWRVFRDLPSWYTEYTYELVAGPPYDSATGLEVGQVHKVVFSYEFPRTAEGGDRDGPDYVISKVIKVDPPHEIVKVLWGAAFDWPSYTSFYVWKLLEDAQGTTVSIDSFGRAELEHPLTRDEYAAYEAAIVENWHRSWSTALRDLRALVERT
jgi:hypothetical protein